MKSSLAWEVDMGLKILLCCFFLTYSETVIESNMTSRLLDCIFSCPNPRDEVKKWLHNIKSVNVNAVMNWMNGARPKGKEFIRIDAQILKIKKQEQSPGKIYNVKSKRDSASKQQQKMLTFDRDSRMVLLR
jgi:hypothetical protein